MHDTYWDGLELPSTPVTALMPWARRAPQLWGADTLLGDYVLRIGNCGQRCALELPDGSVALYGSVHSALSRAAGDYHERAVVARARLRAQVDAAE